MGLIRPPYIKGVGDSEVFTFMALWEFTLVYPLLKPKFSHGDLTGKLAQIIKSEPRKIPQKIGAKALVKRGTWKTLEHPNMKGENHSQNIQV